MAHLAHHVADKTPRALEKLLAVTLSLTLATTAVAALPLSARGDTPAEPSEPVAATNSSLGDAMARDSSAQEEGAGVSMGTEGASGPSQVEEEAPGNDSPVSEGASAAEVEPTAKTTEALSETTTADTLAADTPAPLLDEGQTLIGDELDGATMQLRPHGYLRMANVHEDGRFVGDALILYQLGTSSKHYLRHIGDGYYVIQSRYLFTEQDLTRYCYWDVDDRSTKDGAVIHVWNGSEDVSSRQWRFIRNADGTYWIQNRNSGKYLALDGSGNDADGTKLVQHSQAVNWDIDFIFCSRDSNINRFSSYTKSTSWMTELPDGVYLSDLTIPGTHDAGTCYTYGNIVPQDSFTTCQQLFIDEQLGAGVRFFDIRMGMDGDADRDPYINHGGTVCETRTGKWLRLSDVVEDFKTFLKAHPGETVLMMASQSGGDVKNQTSALWKLMEDNPGLFYAEDAIPTLGEARGKIVLMRRIVPQGTDAGKSDFGLDLSSWGSYGDDFPSTKGLVKIRDTSEFQVWAQDNYATTADNKIAYVQGAFSEALGKRKDAASAGKRCLILNYTSCTKNNPFTAARNMNERLFNESCLAEDHAGYLGIVVMDFVDARQAQSVYAQNAYLENPNYWMTTTTPKPETPSDPEPEKQPDNATSDSAEPKDDEGAEPSSDKKPSTARATTPLAATGDDGLPWEPLAFALVGSVLLAVGARGALSRRS